MRTLLIILFTFMVCAIYAQPNTVNIGSAGNDGTGDPLRTAMQKLNGNDAAAFDSLASHETRLGQLEVWRVNKVREWTTCPYNDTTNFIIGSTTQDIGFIIHYVSERNTGGYFQVESGIINVAYNNDNGGVYIYSEYIGIDNGLDIEADVSGTYIRLNVIVDNSIATNATFDWKLTSKFSQ